MGMESVLVIPAKRQMIIIDNTVTWKMVVKWETGVLQIFLPVRQLESVC